MTVFEAFLSSRIVCTDSRAIKPGCIYFALKGERFNGHAFVVQALKDGASYAVVDEEVHTEDASKLIRVPDVLTALQACATEYREYLKIPVVGLTGSNGKTTNKELFYEVLSRKFRVHATPGNFNNHIGVPLTLLSIPEGTEIAVVEMGANHQREIAALSEIARPNIGYITNYGKAHMEGFGGVQGIIKGKSELYDFIRESRGLILRNEDDPIQLERSTGCQAYTFGTGDAVDVQWRKTQKGEMAAISFKHEGEWYSVQSQLSGDFNQTNIAAAVALGIHFGVPPQAIAEAIEGYTPAMNRVEWRKTESNNVLLDAYNANPTSMALSVESFATWHKDGWMVLGDMFELGEAAAEEHQAIVDQIVALGMSERTLLVGALFGGTNWTGLCFANTEEVLKYWNENGAPKDAAILLKGSRGMALERLLPAL